MPAAMVGMGVLNEATKQAAAGAAKQDRKKKSNMRYKRKGGGWETFRCSCGNTLQLSPTFSAPKITCRKCNAKVEVS